jgi:hypothetical protein
MKKRKLGSLEVSTLVLGCVRYEEAGMAAVHL